MEGLVATLALVETMAMPAARQSLAATGCAVTRIPKDFDLPVSKREVPGLAGHNQVTGPGQLLCIISCRSRGSALIKWANLSKQSEIKIKPLSGERFFNLSKRMIAFVFRGSQPSPKQDSVGYATTPPRFMILAAVRICSSSIFI